MKIFIAYLLPVLFILIACNRDFNPEISSIDLKSHLDYLAGDSLKGRYPGTSEDSVLMEYIAGEFEKYGLKPLGDNYIEKFSIISGTEFSENNILFFASDTFRQQEDFIPRNYSASAEVEAAVVFAGYGMEFKTDSVEWNDYQGLDVNGKWLMILLGEPSAGQVYMDRSRETDKVMLARDKGAAGVLFVAGTDYDSRDVLEASGNPEASLSIPVIRISRNLADQILKENYTTVEKLEKTLSASGKVRPVESSKELNAGIEVHRKYSRTGNVCAWIEGSDPELKQEYVIIGAHHDHLGMGGEGSSSRRPDTIAIHYGADDNASGVASVLEAAAWFAGQETAPLRSIIFCTFAAEEKGLLGSGNFVENMKIKPEDISLMINADMVGRMKKDSVLQIGGVGTAAELRLMLNSLNENYHFNMELSEAGYGPSDHASFYRKDIPVVFLSTGPHKDYHTPFDRVDSLNIVGLAMIDHFIVDLASETANLDRRLIYQEAGSQGKYFPELS